MPSSDEEVEVLSREDARRIAESIIGQGDPLAHLDIAPSLLSTQHIEAYVQATGLIGPFFKGGHPPRLKKASYECRMGTKAYIFREGDPELMPFRDGRLLVPPNSIVFVESDLDFRLPDFIALRFNLHIRHVHRGLLLGTGPLVDPGFWGKLCIPLHNLTSEPYQIPVEDGLIWVEFTKTTSSGSEPEGADPSNKGFWNIEEFILKASYNRFDKTYTPIRSSIPLVVLEANNRSSSALAIAKHSETTANSARTTVNRLRNFGALALVALIVGCWSLVTSQNQLVRGYIDGALGWVKSTGDEVKSLRSDTEQFRDRFNDLNVKVDDLGRLTGRIDALERQIIEMNSKIDELDTLLRQKDSSSAPPP